MELHKLTLKQAAEGLRKKQFTSVELTQACLAQIKKRNKDLNAFITISEDRAIAEAKLADEMIENGQATELTGIPFSVKDSIATADIRSTAAAKILDNYTPVFEATVVEKIRKAGGVLIGKTNCDAFGHGASNENSMYGAVRNPYNLKKVSGGSSGGSAVSVADHMCFYSIAEDTGGSIRQPASFCGVFGLRPTYGRNSRYGVMPMASSLDVVGPMARTAEDLAIVLKYMAGTDKKDATTTVATVDNYDLIAEKEISAQGGSASGGKKSKLVVGIPKEYFEIEGINEEIKKNVLYQIEKFKEQGAEIVEVSLPHTKYAMAVYYIVVPSEDSSNMARLDGIRYGVREKKIKSLSELYEVSRANGFPEEVKRRILIGTYVLSAGYYEAYYKKAQKVRTLIKSDFEKVFKEVDILIAPTSPFPAFELGEKKSDPLQMYLADVMLSPAAVAGYPALSVPTGFTAEGLPIGTQIIGDKMKEGLLLQVGKFLTKKD
ncbi:MAG TPA: Asp-tRNA(Asn)/Glu-tRNA(Gln) amidotransferase subunit GatA [Candidatus Magasanikbacteria bacterium]|nr:Asp-tRNA(Asn)/Glu-tRNA(Gln) amidotransferase subunit GatA [Candidatus Magasanikbacteria bacterium]